MTGIHLLETEESVDTFLSAPGPGGKGLKLIHFKSDWSEPCKQMTEILLELEGDKDNSGVKFAEINAENLPTVSMKYNIAAVPTVLLFADAKEIDRVDGLRKAKLSEAIKSYISKAGNNGVGVGLEAPVLTVKKSTADAEPLEDRLKALINKHDIMVFMKGDPSTPRCGFSRTLMGILTETGLPFDTFDILQDEEVRQGLKTFSNWQTYPQVYVKGELIGGLDIVKELVESNELVATLKGES